MGKKQSKLIQEGYEISKEDGNNVIATKGNDTFIIKIINKQQLSKHAVKSLTSEMKILNDINHPHVVNIKNSFQDENEIFYVVMDHCQGGSLADRIERIPNSLNQNEVLSLVAEICMALKVIHEKGLRHNALTPKNVIITKYGLVCLSGFENISDRSQGPFNITSNANVNYMAPELLTGGTFDEKRDIWSLGCILFELCTKKQAFFSKNAVKLIPKITSGTCPTLPNNFSPELDDLLSCLLKINPQERPSANDILASPIVLRCLITKSTSTVMELKIKLKDLRALADDLEHFHENATIGSLTGGVIGAVGGITSIVGLILAPFTLGASLIVTGVGVGIGAVGGLGAGASNITNMIKQSSGRKTFCRMIKEMEQKTNAVVTWLLEIGNSLKYIGSFCPQTPDTDGNFKEENLKRLGLRIGKGLSGISELVRLARVVNIGKIAAQASRTVRAAEVATGIFSGLFVAMDIIFIAMDAKEIYQIKRAREAGSTPDQNQLSKESDAAEGEHRTQDESSPKKAEIRSEVMKFVQSVRDAADKLEKILNDLETIISNINVFPAKNEKKRQNTK